MRDGEGGAAERAPSPEHARGVSMHVAPSSGPSAVPGGDLLTSYARQLPMVHYIRNDLVTRTKVTGFISAHHLGPVWGRAKTR